MAPVSMRQSILVVVGWLIDEPELLVKMVCRQDAFLIAAKVGLVKVQLQFNATLE